MMARSTKGSNQRPDTLMQDRTSANSKNFSCNARPDHTFGSASDLSPADVWTAGGRVCGVLHGAPAVQWFVARLPPCLPDRWRISAADRRMATQRVKFTVCDRWVYLDMRRRQPNRNGANDGLHWQRY